MELWSCTYTYDFVAASSSSSSLLVANEPCHGHVLHNAGIFCTANPNRTQPPRGKYSITTTRRILTRFRYVSRIFTCTSIRSKVPIPKGAMHPIDRSFFSPPSSLQGCLIPPCIYPSEGNTRHVTTDQDEILRIDKACCAVPCIACYLLHARTTHE